MNWLRDLGSAFGAIFRDKAALSVMVVAIIVYGLLYPQPYLGEVVREAPVVALDQDNSAASRALLRQIDVFEATRVVGNIADMAEARRALLGRQAFAIVVIPENFERDLKAGRASPIAAYGDASYFLLYNSTMTAISTAARQTGAQVVASRKIAQGEGARAATSVQPFTISAVPLFNPQGGYASYVVPASVILILQQTLLMGVALLNTGRSHPRHALRPISTMLARLVAYGGLYVIWMLAYLIVLPVLLGLPRIGSLTDLFVLGLPFLLSTMFLGLVIARLLPIREWAIMAMMALGMPLFFLSGVAWPMEMLPEWMIWLGKLMPSSSAIPGIVRVNQMGASWQDVATQVATLWGLTGIYGALALLGLGNSEKSRNAMA